MILPIKYINGKSPKQSSSGRFFIGSVPNTGRSVKIFMINFCIGTFLKLPASGGFPQTGFVLSLSFLLPNIFFGKMVLWSFWRNLPTATDFDFISQKYPRIRVIRRYLVLAKSIALLGCCNGFSAK